jgi:ferredoxin-NADP reductase
MIRYATDKLLPRQIVLFDSNRNEEIILYRKDFDESANANANKHLTIIYTITGEGQEATSSSSVSVPDDWKGESGFINKVMLTTHLTSEELDNSIFYVCGPPEMLKAMQKLSQENLQISMERIKIEEFTVY